MTVEDSMKLAMYELGVEGFSAKVAEGANPVKGANSANSAEVVYLEFLDGKITLYIPINTEISKCKIKDRLCNKLTFVAPNLGITTLQPLMILNEG